jgi:methyl-accepting chemotaxis protein
LSKGSEEVSGAVQEIADVSRESTAGIQDIAASAEEQLLQWKKSVRLLPHLNKWRKICEI